jgi:DNA-binding XRE family transcriptional regulator
MWCLKHFVFKQWEEVNRIMHAWCCNMEDQTIATAFIEGDRLVVFDCTHRRLEVKFDQLKSLSAIAKSERNNFKISKWGEYLYWPAYDLHVDIIDAIRYRADRNYQKKKQLESLAHYKAYGRAVQAFRKQHGLSREDIQNLGEISAKTIQRVEAGKAELSVKTLDALAKAHKLSTNKYLSELAIITQRGLTNRSMH